MKDPLFVAQLAVKLLPGNRKEEVESKPTTAEATTCFLDKEIKPAIESGDNESFNILLSIMEAFGSIHLNKLAESIKQEIEKIVIQINEPSISKNIIIILCSYHFICISVATTNILNSTYVQLLASY